jgi:hypothetical protein
VSDTSIRLDHEQWTARADAYAARVDMFVAPHVERARAGEADPVWDFLFSYYSLRPGQLRCWHPGYGMRLAGSQAIRRYRGRRGYTADGVGVTVSQTYLRSRLDTISFVARLLRTTARRPARLSCFGLHEWAMVYHDGAVRHQRVPLRLGGAGTDTVVHAEIAGPLGCSRSGSSVLTLKPTCCPAMRARPAAPPNSTGSSPVACTPTWTCPVV